MAYAQDNAGQDAQGQPLAPAIDENGIAQMRECAAQARTKIMAEVKAQRLADTYGAHGWRAVKGKLNCQKFYY